MKKGSGDCIAAVARPLVELPAAIRVVPGKHLFVLPRPLVYMRSPGSVQLMPRLTWPWFWFDGQFFRLARTDLTFDWCETLNDPYGHPQSIRVVKSVADTIYHDAAYTAETVVKGVLDLAQSYPEQDVE